MGAVRAGEKLQEGCLSLEFSLSKGKTVLAWCIKEVPVSQENLCHLLAYDV